MSKVLLFGCGFLVLLSNPCMAQIQLPTVDVEVKIHQSFIPGDAYNDGAVEFSETTNLQGAVFVQINQYVALGGFYGRSFRGRAIIKMGSETFNEDVLQLRKGLQLRLSTGRAKKWRQHLTLGYFQLELIQDLEDFRLADKTIAFSANLGITRKITNNLSICVLEVGGGVMKKDIFWYRSNSNRFYLDGKVGLNYTIGKKK